MATFATTMTALALALLMTSSSFRAGQAQSPTSAPMPMVTPGPSSGGPTTAQGPAGAESDCMTLVLGMADCLAYVQIGSNATKPDAACCPELKTLVDTNPVCLCQMLANSSDYSIDVNRATKLPSVCKVETPPVSTCAVLGYPVGGPTASEGPASSESPSSGIGPSAGSSTAPSPPENDGGRSSSVSFASIFTIMVIGFAISLF